MQELKDLTNDFDNIVGGLSVQLDTLNHIKTELGAMSGKVENTEHDPTSMAMQFYGIRHKVQLLDDLLYYTLEDMNTTFEETESIKEKYFNLIIHEGVKVDG